jgi:3-deoxy-D-manno-octulosonic acid kinase
MKVQTLIKRHLAIVYDGETVEDPTPTLFDPDYWRQAEGLLGSAPGRGSALFLKTPFAPAVLRLYLRGGWAARFSHDRYFYTGYSRSRPFREFHLLAWMRQQGLPVPEPLAAMCEHKGILSRGALLTRTIPGVTALADLIESGIGSGRWRSIGACIARFHKLGVDHADLNARNVLLQEDPHSIFLVDFDRGRVKPGTSVNGRRNLARLRRSLEKWWPQERLSEFGACWDELLGGYHGG